MAVLTGDTVDTEAKNLETRINNHIKEKWPDWSPLEAKSRIEMYCTTVLGAASTSPWKYNIVQPIGGYPTVIITEYDPRKAR